MTKSLYYDTDQYCTRPGLFDEHVRFRINQPITGYFNRHSGTDHRLEFGSTFSK